MKTNQEVIKYIDSLKNYCGYVQFSDEKLRECDIFKEYQEIKLSPTDGFIYEAHFFNGVDSISIRQINGSWLVSENKNIPLTDTQDYISNIENFPKIKMAQIWEEVDDEFCENMKVKKLLKVLFAGFNGMKSVNKTQEIKEKYTPKQKEILLNHFLNIFKDEYIDKVLGEVK